jgi:hypothetical protein
MPEGKGMNPGNGEPSEQVFSELTDQGYSEKVAKAVWRWYQPDLKIVDKRK